MKQRYSPLKVSFEGDWWVCNHWCHGCYRDSLIRPVRWGKKGITIELSCVCGKKEWRRVFRTERDAFRSR